MNDLKSTVKMKVPPEFQTYKSEIDRSLMQSQKGKRVSELRLDNFIQDQEGITVAEKIKRFWDFEEKVIKI